MSPSVLKFPPQNCVFHLTKIHGIVLKKPIRIEYLINQKSQGTQNSSEQLHNWRRVDEEGSNHLVFLN